MSESGDIGLTGAISMALGGMIGGGIYAVTGVVVGIAVVALVVELAYFEIGEIRTLFGEEET